MQGCKDARMQGCKDWFGRCTLVWRASFVASAPTCLGWDHRHGGDGIRSALGVADLVWETYSELRVGLREVCPDCRTDEAIGPVSAAAVVIIS
jgi:hypothetical protein